MDRHLRGKAVLTIYGSAALILMDEVGRTSLDIDVAGPFSRADIADVKRAAEKVGLRVNPEEDYPGDHIEWISLPRLCLSRPDSETAVVLWQGRKLTVKTVSPAHLIASKLIRYDEIDQTDIRFLCFQMKVSFPEIAEAVRALPPAFRDDAMVKENLCNLKTDMGLWRKRHT